MTRCTTSTTWPRGSPTSPAAEQRHRGQGPDEVLRVVARGAAVRREPPRPMEATAQITAGDRLQRTDRPDAGGTRAWPASGTQASGGAGGNRTPVRRAVIARATTIPGLRLSAAAPPGRVARW